MGQVLIEAGKELDKALPSSLTINPPVVEPAPPRS